MSDRAYDQGVADGIRSGNTGLHELSKQIADLHSKLQAAEGKIELARDVLDRRYRADAANGVSHTTAVQVALAILTEPTNAGGIASEGGSAEAANPRKEKADAPSAEAGDAKDPWSARVQASIDALTQPDQPDWQALAGELAEKGQVFLDADSSDAMQATAEDLQGALARYDEATAQHSGEER